MTVGFVSSARLWRYSGSTTRTVSNTLQLIQWQPLVLIGCFGLEATNAAVNTASAVGVPVIGAISGNGSGSILSNSCIVNLRARYSDEMNALLNYATSVLGLTRISVFFTGDAFGLEGVSEGRLRCDWLVTAQQRELQRQLWGCSTRSMPLVIPAIPRQPAAPAAIHSGRLGIPRHCAPQGIALQRHDVPAYSLAAEQVVSLNVLKAQQTVALTEESIGTPAWCVRGAESRNH